jgi:hypothetical protein
MRIIEDNNWKVIKLPASNIAWQDRQCKIETHPIRDDYLITITNKKTLKEVNFAIKKKVLKEALKLL